MSRSPPESGLRRFGAVWLSRLFHPFIVGTGVLFALQRLGGEPVASALGWTALASAVLIAPMLAFLLVGVRRGRYRDLDVSVREDRFLLYRLGALAFIASLALFAALRAPPIAQQALQAALLAFVAGAVANRFVNKLSLHSLNLAGAAVALLFVSLPAGTVVGVAALLVGWARIHLTRHTRTEVVLGWLLGALCVGLWFGFAPTG